MSIRDQISDDELAALDKRFAEEDRRAAEEPEVPEEERVVQPHNAFASQGAVPREVNGIPFEDLK